MQTDITTLEDLNIFSGNESFSIFHKLNHTVTPGGREWLRILLNRPLSDVNKINDTQALIKYLMNIHAQWPSLISSGTIMVVEKFYSTPIEAIPVKPNAINSFLYRMVNLQDYSLIKYSVEHFMVFFKGMAKVAAILEEDNIPELFKPIIRRLHYLLNNPTPNAYLNAGNIKTLNKKQILLLGGLIRKFKNAAMEVIEIYFQMDAYNSLAIAAIQNNLCFPTFTNDNKPLLEVKGLYHLLVKDAVDYDITLNEERNFLFLTGANMAGKSTFIKAVGVAAYLAHLGFPVPALSMNISLKYGLLSNITTHDNIVKGESFFYNEVQRIKKTIGKITGGDHWIILIDELFKGTNVQDAMKCSLTVIEGLQKIKSSLFIVSTHLYEISEHLKRFDNIQFRYFETAVEGDKLLFNYTLKPGVSKDRLGYLILKREGVTDMLDKI